MFPVSRRNPASRPTNRLDGFFDGLFGDGSGPVAPARSWPPAAMWEDDDSVHFELDLPGVLDEDISMTVHDGTLFVRFERKPAGVRRCGCDGRRYGRFERAFALPDALDVDGAAAALTGGVLRIDLPRSPEAKPRKITLKMD